MPTDLHRPVSCPDCGVETSRIRLLDFPGGPRDMELKYASMDAKGVAGKYNPEGWITGRLCPDCGRVLLYAVTADDLRRSVNT